MLDLLDRWMMLWQSYTFYFYCMYVCKYVQDGRAQAPRLENTWAAVKTVHHVELSFLCMCVIRGNQIVRTDVTPRLIVGEIEGNDACDDGRIVKSVS